MGRVLVLELQYEKLSRFAVGAASRLARAGFDLGIPKQVREET